MKEKPLVHYTDRETDQLNAIRGVLPTNGIYDPTIEEAVQVLRVVNEARGDLFDCGVPGCVHGHTHVADLCVPNESTGDPATCGHDIEKAINGGRFQCCGCGAVRS